MATDAHRTFDFSYFLFRNGCFAPCVGGCLWLWTLTFSAVRDKIFIQYLKSKISNTRREDGFYLVKSSHRRSVLTSKAPKTSSRIWIKSLLSSVKVWGSGSRPLSVRNFNRTVKIQTERWGLRGLKRTTFKMNYDFTEQPEHTVTTPIKKIRPWLHHQPLNLTGPTLPLLKKKENAPIQKPVQSKSASSVSIRITWSRHQHFAPTFPVRPLTQTTWGNQTTPQPFPLLQCTWLLWWWVSFILQPCPLSLKPWRVLKTGTNGITGNETQFHKNT